MPYLSLYFIKTHSHSDTSVLYIYISIIKHFIPSLTKI
ncbi:unnamed protein product [Nezara viridula]|uniref:Uncharacterized protein n=1 Tax=Nezara viridula TaxID=85310 RepID=A0A9P0E8S5_NEZVI|nr:unnamed protein product [Nezara viridula]